MIWPFVQVKTALKNLTEESSETLREELELKQTLAAAATALQVRKLLVAAVPEVAKNCQLLLLQGVSIPLHHRMVISMRAAVVHLGNNEASKWVQALSVARQAEWDPKDISFAGCMTDLAAAVQEEGDEPSAAESPLRIFQEVYPAAVFPDGFMRRLNAASVEGSAEESVAAAAPLLELCRIYLEQLKRESEEIKIPECVKKVLQDCGKVMRGIQCMASAEPTSAELADLEYIMPKNATSAAVLKDLPRLGRIFVSKFRREEVAGLLCAREEPFALPLHIHSMSHITCCHVNKL